jgi:hypothetical protein
LVLLVVGLPLVMTGALLLAGHLPAVRARAHRWAEDALARRLGHEVRAERADVQLFRARFALHHVRVASHGPLADGTLLDVEAIRFGLSWSALFRRTLVVNGLELIRPRLNLLPSATPGAPWTGWLQVLLEAGRPAPGAWAVDIPRLEIREGVVSWKANGLPGRLEGVQGVLERRNRDGAARLAGDLRAARFLAPWAGGIRELTEVRMRADAAAADVQIAAAEAVIAGGRVAVKGRILVSAGAEHLDLNLTLSSPLIPLLKHVGLPQDVDAHVEAAGNLRGSWSHLAFQGHGEVRLATPPRKTDAVAFDLRWVAGRLEFEASQSGKPHALWWRLILEPATGAYRARLKAQGADLDRLTGVPALAARLAGFELPAAVGGRLVADVDLTGLGADLTTMRGRGVFRVDDLTVDPGLPPGRLEAEILASATQLAVRTVSLHVPGGTVRGKGRVTFADGRVDLPFEADFRNVAALARGFGFPLLGGNATLVGRLAGTRDAPRLQAHLTWREPRVGLYGVDRVEGEIEWLPRTLRSPRLIARIGQTVATLQGGAVAKGTAPLRSLDLRSDVTLDLQWRVGPGRTADVIQFLPAGLDVQGSFTAAGRLTGEPGALEGEIEAACTNLRTWNEKWQRGDAVLRFRPGALEISPLSLRRGTERLSGDFRVEEGGTLTGRFTSTPLDLGGIGVVAGSRLAGRAVLQGEVQGTVYGPRVAGSATTDALSFRDVQLGPAVATFATADKTVDVDIALGGGSQRVRLHFDPPPERDLRVQVDLSNADLAPLLELAEVEHLKKIPGRGTGRILLRGPVRNFVNAVGEARLDALRLHWDGEEWSNRDAVELTWRGRTVDLRQVRLASGTRTLDLRGSLAADGEADLRLRGRVPLLALAGRLPMAQPVAGTATADLQVRGTLRAPQIRGTMDVAEGRLTFAGLPVPFEDVQGTVELEDERGILRSVQGKLAGGAVRATGDVSSSDDRWSFRIALQAEGNRAEQLLAGRSGGYDLTGALSLAGSLTSQGRNDAGVLPNLAGNLKMVLRDGQFGRKTLIVRMFSLMNLTELFTPKTAGGEGPGIPYRRLTSDIVIDGGVARTENLLLESPAFHLSAVGQVDLTDETVEMDVAVKPLRAVDKLMTTIPLAGWVLGGKEGALIAAFFRVTGTVSDPKVTSLPLKSIGRATFGSFRRLLELPEAVTAP